MMGDGWLYSNDSRGSAVFPITKLQKENASRVARTRRPPPLFPPSFTLLLLLPPPPYTPPPLFTEQKWKSFLLLPAAVELKLLLLVAVERFFRTQPTITSLGNKTLIGPGCCFNAHRELWCYSWEWFEEPRRQETWPTFPGRKQKTGALPESKALH